VLPPPRDVAGALPAGGCSCGRGMLFFLSIWDAHLRAHFVFVVVGEKSYENESA
jgi:hypothetical protein